MRRGEEMRSGQRRVEMRTAERREDRRWEVRRGDEDRGEKSREERWYVKWREMERWGQKRGEKRGDEDRGEKSRNEKWSEEKWRDEDRGEERRQEKRREEMKWGQRREEKTGEVKRNEEMRTEERREVKRREEERRQERRWGQRREEKWSEEKWRVEDREEKRSEEKTGEKKAGEEKRREMRTEERRGGQRRADHIISQHDLRKTAVYYYQSDSPQDLTSWNEVWKSLMFSPSIIKPRRVLLPIVLYAHVKCFLLLVICLVYFTFSTSRLMFYWWSDMMHFNIGPIPPYSKQNLTDIFSNTFSKTQQHTLESKEKWICLFVCCVVVWVQHWRNRFIDKTSLDFWDKNDCISISSFKEWNPCSIIRNNLTVWMHQNSLCMSSILWFACQHNAWQGNCMQFYYGGGWRYQQYHRVDNYTYWPDEACKAMTGLANGRNKATGFLTILNREEAALFDGK